MFSNVKQFFAMYQETDNIYIYIQLVTSNHILAPDFGVPIKLEIFPEAEATMVPCYHSANIYSILFCSVHFRRVLNKL